MRTGKDRVYVDAVNMPIELSNVQAFPNDIVFGDDSGVIIIPASMAENVIDVAEQIGEKEELILQLIEKGHSLKEAREITGYHHLQTKITD